MVFNLYNLLVLDMCAGVEGNVNDSRTFGVMYVVNTIWWVSLAYLVSTTQRAPHTVGILQ